MKKVKVKKVRSVIGRPERQKRSMEALGLRKHGASVQHILTPQIAGMIKKVAHLVQVTPLEEE